MELKRIALFLAGDFPPHYQQCFDESLFAKSVRSVSGGLIDKEDTDEMHQYAKSSSDFFYMALNRLNKASETSGKDFLGELFAIIEINIPPDVSGISVIMPWRPLNKAVFFDLLDSFNEIPATEEIIAPILSNTFDVVGPRGHVIKHGEWGHDIEIISYPAAFGVRYIGFQIKKGNIGEGDVSGTGNILAQLETAMDSEKPAADGNIVLPNEMMLIATGVIHEVVRQRLIENWKRTRPNSRLIIWDREQIYQQVLKYGLPKEPSRPKIILSKKAKAKPSKKQSSKI